MILDLCGGTGGWSKPYQDAGYDVVVADIKTGIDVRYFKIPDEPIRGVLAAPPCTHLAGSGSRWWAVKPPALLFESLSIVAACLQIVRLANPTWWALENPVGRLGKYIGDWRWTFDPCDYGDPWTKRTCIWGSHRIPDRNPVTPEFSWADVKRDPTERSITSPGFAKAFFLANP